MRRVSGPLAAVAAVLLIAGCSSGDGTADGPDSADGQEGSESSEGPGGREPDGFGDAEDAALEGSWGAEGQLLHIAAGIGTLVETGQVCVGTVTGTSLALGCPAGGDAYAAGEATVDGAELTVGWAGGSVTYTQLAGPGVELADLAPEGVELAELGLDDLPFDLGDIDLGDLGELPDLPDIGLEGELP